MEYPILDESPATFDNFMICSSFQCLTTDKTGLLQPSHQWNSSDYSDLSLRQASYTSAPSIIPSLVDGTQACALVENSLLLRSDEQKTKQQRRLYDESEWSSIRPIFEKLYLSPGMRLIDVQKKLSEDHNFHATISMFKKHITKWQIMKNIKAGDKNTVMHTLESRIKNGTTTSNPDMKLLRKTLRHAQQLRRAHQISDATYNKLLEYYKALRKSKQTHHTWLSTSDHRNRTPKNLITTNGESPFKWFINTTSRMERFLNATKECISCSIKIASPSVNRSGAYRGGSKVVRLLCEAGSYLRFRAYSSARRVLSNMGEAIGKDLQTKSLWLLLGILIELRGWGDDPQTAWRRVIVRYLVGETLRALGNSSPTYTFLLMLDEGFSSSQCLLRTYECILDTLSDFRASISVKCFFYVQWNQLRTLRKLLDFAGAKRLSEDMLARFPQSSGFSNLHLTIMREQARYEMQQGLIYEGIHTLEVCYGKAQELRNFFSMFRVCNNLGFAYYYDLKDMNQAIHWFRAGLNHFKETKAISSSIWEHVATVLKLLRPTKQREHIRAIIEDFADAYHELLEYTDDKAQYLYGWPCSLGRSNCICQGSFASETIDKSMENLDRVSGRK